MSNGCLVVPCLPDSIARSDERCGLPFDVAQVGTVGVTQNSPPDAFYVQGRRNASPNSRQDLI